jgi:hypothetical protein
MAKPKVFSCNICEDTKSVFTKGAWIPCECLESEKLSIKLLSSGIATIKEPIILNSKKDPEMFNQSLYLRSKDVPNILMPALSGIFTKAFESKDFVSCHFTTAYGLVITFLGNDEKHKMIDDYVNYSYLAIMLNYGDSTPNKLLNKLVRHVLENRTLRDKSTYILSDVPKHELPDVYTEDEKLYEYIKEMKEFNLDKMVKK